MCTGTRYGVLMIRSFRHRGLKRLYERGDGARVAAEQLPRIQDVLGRLDVAVSPEDLNLPGYRLHRLKGGSAGYWSISISGNWRIIFRVAEGDVFDVNLVDYH